MKQRVGQYLMGAVYPAGADKAFGVPGDFSLAFLDDIITHNDIKWIGNTNELNAGYATDEYARTNGIGTMVTTLGVSELSAVNGIARLYAERVPVIAITGAPTRAVEQEGKYVHHSLGEGTFDDYRKMSEPTTTAQAYITPDNATTEIPRVISMMLQQHRPVHIHLPTDVALTEIKILNPFKPEVEPQKNIRSYISVVQGKLELASQPVTITGHKINNFHLHKELEQFVSRTQIPVV